MAIDPSRSVPQDVATVQSLQSTTEESAKAAMRAPVDAAWGQARGSVFGNLLGFVVGGIADALRGIFTPGGLFSPVGDAMQEFRDGQEDLTDRTDLLSPLLDYGSAFIDPDNRVHGTGYAVFSRQLGPMRGCELITDSQGGIRLLDKGLWDIRVHLTADGIVQISSNAPFRYELRVFTPSGVLFSRQIFHANDMDPLTGTVVSSVVVDEPGYRVRVYVLKMASRRGVLGGPAWSRLAVQHIARDVDGAWSRGNESSSTASS